MRLIRALALTLVVLASVTSRATAASDVLPKPVPSGSEADPPPDGSISWERYRILTQRNMFSKERGRPREESRRDRSREVEKAAAPQAPKEESFTVLIGVVQKDGVPAAILENRSSGKIQTVVKGAAIGSGAIKAISLDSLDFESEGVLHVIKIGQTFTGVAPSSAAPVATGTSGTTTTSGPAVGTTTPGTAPAGSPASGPAAAPSGGGDSVLERMRRRRQEEMRK